MTYTLALLAQQRWDQHPMHGWDGGWTRLRGTLTMLTWAVVIAAAWLIKALGDAARKGILARNVDSGASAFCAARSTPEPSIGRARGSSIRVYASGSLLSPTQGLVSGIGITALRRDSGAQGVGPGGWGLGERADRWGDVTRALPRSGASSEPRAVQRARGASLGVGGFDRFGTKGLTVVGDWASLVPPLALGGWMSTLTWRE